jgi:hypothetical protein
MVLDKLQDAVFAGPVPDVRPSKAHPEHRAKRKQLEKEHPAFSMQEFGIKAGMMALLAAVACFPWEKEVEKHHERRRQEEEGEERKKGEKDKSGSRGGERRSAGRYGDGDGYEYRGTRDRRDGRRRDADMKRRDREERGERMRRYEDERDERRERKRRDKERW